MKTARETKFRNACSSILLVIDYFDDEVYDDEEICKEDLSNFIQELSDKYRQ